MKKLLLLLLFNPIFCIAQVIPGDCIFSATDITTLINSINPPGVPFASAAYVYSAAGNVPTRDNVAGDPNSCNGCTVTCSPSIADHRDRWFKFTVSAATPNTWVSVFNKTTESTLYSIGLYSGTPGGTCGTGGAGITGLTAIDCSAGEGYVCVGTCCSAAGCGTSGGSRDKAICTTPTAPRLSIASLPAGTYYLRVWQWMGGTPSNGNFNLVVETDQVSGVSSDGCVSINTIGCLNPDDNANVDTTYTNLTNAGTTGNACNTAPNEPQLAATAAGEYQQNCAPGWTIPLGVGNNVINNTAIYRFQVKSAAPCQANLAINFNNITYAGTDNKSIQVQVMPSQCVNATNAIITANTNMPCITMRPSGNAPVASGLYYIIVDGQDGQKGKYDLNLKITYSGAGCTPLNPKNKCNALAVALQLTSFDLIKDKNKASLRWTCENVENINSFVLQKSINGTDFFYVANIFPEKNNLGSNKYSYSDEVNKASKVYYRLLIIENNGKTYYSSVKMLNFQAENWIRLNGTILKDPSTLTLKLETDFPEIFSYAVFDLQGRVNLSGSVMASPDSPECNIDISKLHSELYVIRVWSETIGTSATHRFIKP